VYSYKKRQSFTRAQMLAYQTRMPRTLVRLWHAEPRCIRAIRVDLADRSLPVGNGRGKLRNPDNTRTVILVWFALMATPLSFTFLCSSGGNEFEVPMVQFGIPAISLSNIEHGGCSGLIKLPEHSPPVSIRSDSRHEPFHDNPKRAGTCSTTKSW
jgi:hypothetical protein